MLDRIEEPAVPDVESILKAEIGDDEGQKSYRANPRYLLARQAPIAARTDQEALKQESLASLLDLLRRQLRDNLVARRHCIFTQVLPPAQNKHTVSPKGSRRFVLTCLRPVH